MRCGHSESCWACTCGKASATLPQPLATVDIRDPLVQCQQSLKAAGLTTIADGKLLDLIGKLDTFGAHLVTLDVRQESTRHSDLMGEITLALELGDYRDWNEAEKQAFLEKEINDLRPLIPIHFKCTAPSGSSRHLCRDRQSTARGLGLLRYFHGVGTSDILVVQLLLKATGGTAGPACVPAI